MNYVSRLKTENSLEWYKKQENLLTARSGFRAKLGVINNAFPRAQKHVTLAATLLFFSSFQLQNVFNMKKWSNMGQEMSKLILKNR